MMRTQLEGKTVLVSGGAGRIGSEISCEIVRRGGRVFVVDIAKSSTLMAVSPEKQDQIFYFHGDATKPEIVERAVTEAVDRFGRLDGAVHSAYPRSAGWGTRFEELVPCYLQEDLSNQLGGTILFAQRIVSALNRTGGGSVVLISSIQGLSAPKFRHYDRTQMTSPIEYSAIKAGVNAVARYLSKYLVGKYIRVNTVSPGGIFDNQPKPFLDRYREECVNKGMLDAKDITGAVCFLLSDDSTFINGQNIVVDDGWSV